MRIHRNLLPLLLSHLIAPPSASASPVWTEDCPEDLSAFSLEKILFEGNAALSEDELRGVIRSSTSGILRFRPMNLERLLGDVHRLRRHYRREGFWDVAVQVDILYDADRRRALPAFRIVEGARRRVGSIRVEGNETFSNAEVFTWTKLVSGDPFDLSRTDLDRESIENTYANRGFHLVQVTADLQAQRSGRGEEVVHDLIHRIEEGPRLHVGKIRVEGNEVTAGSIIRRELMIESGDVLSRERLIGSRRRLYATGFFSRVELIPELRGEEEHDVDVVVKVTERNMRFVSVGLGYGTRDQLRVSGEWGHRNLWGQGKQATLRGIVASELFPADLVRTRLEGRFVEPWLFGTRTTGTADLFYERRRESYRQEETLHQLEYDLSLVSLGVNVNRRFSRF
ncbi:MAG: hypothetical protein CME07_00570, partial [Gemmatimonadetes bacterium]|nr:hypothetical protein [Gemmatimonadota bacterium]